MANTVQVKLNNGNIVSVREGSNAYNQYKNSIVSNPMTQQQATQHNMNNRQNITANTGITNNVNTSNSYTNNSPSPSAYNTASFNGSNYNDRSGVIVGGKELTHGEAIAHNPLHSVNAQRQSLIQDALKSGNWDAYNSFESAQKASEGQYWTQNPVFQGNSQLLSDTLNFSNNYGSADEQQVRQSVNQQAMQSYLNSFGQQPYQQQYQQDTSYIDKLFSQQQSAYDAQMKQQQAMLDAMNKQLEEAKRQAEQAQKDSDYKKNEINNATGGGGSLSGGANLDHIFSPGETSGQGGYVENQLITNDAFNRYLQNIFNGGF